MNVNYVYRFYFRCRGIVSDGLFYGEGLVYALYVCWLRVTGRVRERADVCGVYLVLRCILARVCAA